eukprot:tig00020553_g10544.t1
MEESRVQLLSSADGCIELNPEALDLLSSVEGPVAVVAISGVYRSGKSALLNEVFSSEGKPIFDVGTTVGPTTDGIWMWASPFNVTLEKGQKARVFILDCEGLGSFRRDQSDDAQMFMLALISSSYFMYNSIGKLGEAALAQLSMLLNLQEHVEVPAKENRAVPPATGSERSLRGLDVEPYEATSSFMPLLNWILRDFTVPSELGDPADYLAHALEPLQETSEKIKRSNRLRRVVCTLFPERDCFAFPNINVRGEFQQKARVLRDRVLADLRPKSIDGKLLTGRLLASLLSKLVESIAQGGQMNPFQSWEELTGAIPAEDVGSALEAAVAGALEVYRQRVGECMLARLPMDEPEFEATHRGARAAALERLAAAAACPETGALPSGALAAFKAGVRDQKRRAAEANAEASAAACRELLARLQEAAQCSTPRASCSDEAEPSSSGAPAAAGAAPTASPGSSSGSARQARTTRKQGNSKATAANSSALANGAQPPPTPAPAPAAQAASPSAAAGSGSGRGRTRSSPRRRRRREPRRRDAGHRAGRLCGGGGGCERAAAGLYSPDGSVANTPQTPRAAQLPTPRAAAGQPTPRAAASRRRGPLGDVDPRLPSAGSTPRAGAPQAAGAGAFPANTVAPTPVKALTAGPLARPALSPRAGPGAGPGAKPKTSPHPSPLLAPQPAAQNPSPRTGPAPSPRLAGAAGPYPGGTTAISRPLHATRDFSVQTPRNGAQSEMHSDTASPGAISRSDMCMQTPRDDESEGPRTERELERLREELKSMQGQVATLRLQLDQARATASSRSSLPPGSPTGWFARVCGLSDSSAGGRLRCSMPSQSMFGCLMFSR